MKSKLFLTVLLLAAITTIGISQKKDVDMLERSERAAQAEEKRISELPSQVRSLVGVKGILVFIGRVYENAKDAGLTKEQLKTDVERKLRLAGIKVYSPKEFWASEGRSALEVVANTVSDDHSLVYGVSVEFSQKTNLARKPHRSFQAATWDKDGIGRCGSTDLAQTVRDKVKDIMDEFIKDYFTANPKE